jgi:hypothetical protein
MSLFFGLSKEQREKRRTFIGGSDAKVIAGGDPDELLRLYLQKTGDLPDKEDATWTRYMQQVVEVAALDWVEEFGCCDARGVKVLSRGKISKRGEQPTSTTWPYVGCTLDGWSQSLDCPLNVKRLSRWTGKKQGQTALEWSVAQYTVSTIHECIATDSLFGYLILVIDGQEPVAQRIDADPFWIEEYVDKCRAFWHCVETKTPPEGSAPIAAPRVEISQMRSINLLNPEDLAACNWAPDAIKLITKFADTEGAHKAHMASRDEIKRLLPEDVATLDYGRFHLTRSKSNAIAMRLNAETGK